MISINKASPRVDIILLNWRGWRDTIACLDSLTMLDYSNRRVLVVDNGSTDDSVKRIRAGHPDVPIIETGRNLGFSGGCNVGMRRALEEGADYVWLLNNDTTVDPQALATMVAVGEADPVIGAVGSVLYYLDSPKDIQAWGGGRVCFWTGRSRHLLNPVTGAKLHYLTAASVLIRRRTLEEIGLLDENTFFMYWEDTDFSFRLRKAGWRLAVADQSIVLHREHAATGKGSPLLDYCFNESAVRFFRRYAPIAAWPISIGTLGRLGKRVLRGNLPGFVATLRGTYAGLRKSR
jgi:GT2 family glycosyltransferase